MGVTKQEGKKLYMIKRSVDIVLALILAAAAIYAIKTVIKDFTDINQKISVDDTISTIENSEDIPSDQSIFVSEAIDNDKIFQGPLIVVNNDTEYKGNEENLKSILSVRNDSKTNCYSVLDNNVKAKSEAASALNSMLVAFNDETGHNDIQVDSGYRSVSEQNNIYESADDKSTASKPGFSDYHTGYSIDLNVVDNEGNGLDFDGTGDYEWFEKNCYKYGFTLRFPKGKEELTGQEYRPWHFRYVGKAHASYMHENNLCLEEYIKELKTYSYDAKHLDVKDFEGKNYEIYYFTADSTTVMTSVAVPSDYEYDVSGNNSDGFIITVNLDKPIDKNNDSVNDDDSSHEDKSTTS